jgi:hypothetical protein
VPLYLFVDTAINKAHKVTGKSLDDAWEVYVCRRLNETSQKNAQGRTWREIRKDLEHDVIVFDDSQIPDVW